MPKTIFISGGSIGIGSSTAIKFAKENWNVIFTYYKDKKEARKTKKLCEQFGNGIIYVLYLNVKDTKSISNCVKKVVEKFGKIEVLVNNAGIICWKHLSEQSFNEIEEQIKVNLEGLIKLTKAFLPYVTEKIINVSSRAGKFGQEDLTTYCATKFGVRGFTQALAKETKLKIYSINPIKTATRMTNYQGVAPEKTADLIFLAANSKKKSGSDFDLWKYSL